MNQTHHEITEELYDDMHECLPPVYLESIDGIKYPRMMACSEACTHLDTVVLTTCYLSLDGKYYQAKCKVYKAEGQPIFDTYNAQWTRNNIAITVN